ncbi:radical SAM family heme chaperone HemW [Clostridium sp. MSJ-11]|uniref:Heme chaperone HemW n=1 Tax=Clostridium mobile TaxID=2841512 RepID=A0ABS6EEA8_9CLOT|nr:radical SAM family heme chaperone HemW [Clostridium mobile]MBU5483533.1 radical SAM family heme chaperone HemW [Clostridium mobile]
MKEISLYIHIPFCKQKCLYCDFPSYGGKEDMMGEYTKALVKELESLPLDKKIKTIFIGGGTPSYLTLENLKILKEAIKGINKDKDIEFTVEINPGTIDEEKLSLFKEMGVNRISIGLQAWQNNLLRELGRIHNLEEFLITYEMCRKFDFNNINIDAMFGLPNQSMKDWVETLENVVKLNPENISCYSLIIEEGTPFYNKYEKGTLILPDEDTEREMYSYCINFLEKNGYKQYEISNFAKVDKECRHNLVYWNLSEYIGIGVGAHSYIEGLRYRHTENISEYIEKVNKGNNINLDIYENTIKDEIEEFMFMGLRKREGISIEEFNKRFKRDIYEVYGEILNKYLQLGLLIEEDGYIFLSIKGIQVSNSIMCEFIL